MRARVQQHVVGVSGHIDHLEAGLRCTGFPGHLAAVQAGHDHIGQQQIDRAGVLLEQRAAHRSPSAASITR
jgi:hypothetical protein